MHLLAVAGARCSHCLQAQACPSALQEPLASRLILLLGAALLHFTFEPNRRSRAFFWWDGAAALPPFLPPAAAGPRCCCLASVEAVTNTGGPAAAAAGFSLPFLVRHPPAATAAC